MADNDGNDEARFLEARRRLGDKIRALRVAKGVSQDEFAFLVGIHRTHIGKLENAKIDPRLTTLQKIAEGLGVALAGLFET